MLAKFNRTLALSLSVIAVALIAAAFIQVQFGLLPLNRVRAALVAVRTGKAERLPEDMPTEVTPLVSDLNALIQTNHEMVWRARTQAGNLAHALKTPLAILTDEASRLKVAGRGELGRLILEQCEQMQRQIDYQMAQARAAASRSAPGAATRIGTAVESVVSAISRLHQDKALAFDVEGPLDTVVASDSEDLSEILANLIDNAAKWARSRVRISVSVQSPSTVRISVEDDGPGLPQEKREVVFKVGERLDERAPGSGLGLAIVRDLTTLYGGRSWIDDSATLGGAAANVELPLAAAA